MTEDERTQLEKIAKQCRRQLAIMPDAPVGFLLNGHWGKSNYRYLFGVKGEIVQEYDYGIYCLFPAQQMLNKVNGKLEAIASTQ